MNQSNFMNKSSVNQYNDVFHCKPWPTTAYSHSELAEFRNSQLWLHNLHGMWRFYQKTLRPEQNGRHFKEEIIEPIFLIKNHCISNQILLKFVLVRPVNIGSGNGVALNKWHAIEYLNQWWPSLRTHVSTGLNELQRTAVKSHQSRMMRLPWRPEPQYNRHKQHTVVPCHATRAGRPSGALLTPRAPRVLEL